METAGLYITIAVLIAVVLLIVFAAIKPHLGKYQIQIKRLESKKRVAKRPSKKQKKQSAWVKVI
jgi:hypothetical protein